MCRPCGWIATKALSGFGTVLWRWGFSVAFNTVRGQPNHEGPRSGPSFKTPRWPGLAITQAPFPESNAPPPPVHRMHLAEVPGECPPDDSLRDHSGCHCC